MLLTMIKMRPLETPSLLTFDIEPPSCVAVRVLPFISNVNDMHIKRLKSIEKEVPYRYLDLFFMNFDDEQNMQRVEAAAATASTKDEICGCYKLLQSKCCLDTTGTVQGRRLEEQTRKYYSRYSGMLAQANMKQRCRGYILMAYKTMPDMSTEKLEQNWKSWSGVRLICELMRPFSFRRLSLYKHCFREAEFRYIILIQTEHLLLSPEASLNIVNYLRERICAHIALYREIDFSLRDDNMKILENPQIFIAKHNLPIDHQVPLNFPAGYQKKLSTEKTENRYNRSNLKTAPDQQQYEMKMFSTKNNELDDTLQICIFETLSDPVNEIRTVQGNDAQKRIPSPAPRCPRPLSALAFHESLLGEQNATMDSSDAIQVSPNGSVYPRSMRSDNKNLI